MDFRCRLLKPEHDRKILPSYVHVIATDHCEPKERQDERQKHCEGASLRPAKIESEATFYRQQYSLVCAPYDVVPGGPMPKPAKNEDQDKRQIAFDSEAHASQRDEQIVTEPAKQGNVPTPPEFRYALCS